MKNWIFFFFSIFLVSCYQEPDPLVGEWKVNSQFYSAAYQILEDDDELSGLILFYDDGTTRYKHDGVKHHYVFTQLRKENEQRYVDGISGATTQNSIPKSIEIKKKNDDTLQVTTYIMKKPLTETWTRK